LRVVAGILKDRRGRVLIARRAAGCRKGLWEFPGGKVEPGESDEEALKREFMEEFGMKIRVERFLGEVWHQYPDLGINLVAYLCTPLGEIKKRTSHSEIAWVEWKKVSSYPLAPADARLLNLIRP